MVALIDPDRFPTVGALVLGSIAAGVVLTIWGAARLAQSNSHHPAWGGFGVFGIIGITIVACLPERVVREEWSRGFEVITSDRPKVR
jgi:hypothetical protein